jgi:hypothetical protein
MASVFYEKMEAKALQMIEKFGAPVTVVFKNKGEIDLVADGYETESEQNAVTSGVSVDFVFNAIKDDENARGAEKKIIVPSLGLPQTPTTEDRIIQGGVEYSIVWVENLNPADLSLIYTIYCKR